MHTLNRTENRNYHYYHHFIQNEGMLLSHAQHAASLQTVAILAWQDVPFKGTGMSFYLRFKG